MCFFTKSLFSTGHSSWFDVLCMSLSLSLSLCSLLHSYIRWSKVWFPPSQGHSGDSIILKRCRYALVFPWAVTKAVKFGVSLMLVDSLSLMFGKNCFVVEPFGVQSHCVCHLAMLWSLTSFISLLGILSKDMSSFLAACFASLSANSLPWIPAWAFIQVKVIVQLRFSSVVACFLISSMR